MSENFPEKLADKYYLENTGNNNTQNFHGDWSLD